MRRRSSSSSRAFNHRSKPTHKPNQLHEEPLRRALRTTSCRCTAPELPATATGFILLPCLRWQASHLKIRVMPMVVTLLQGAGVGGTLVFTGRSTSGSASGLTHAPSAAWHTALTAPFAPRCTQSPRPCPSRLAHQARLCLQLRLRSAHVLPIYRRERTSIASRISVVYSGIRSMHCATSAPSSIRLSRGQLFTKPHTEEDSLLERKTYHCADECRMALHLGAHLRAQEFAQLSRASAGRVSTTWRTANRGVDGPLCAVVDQGALTAGGAKRVRTISSFVISSRFSYARTHTHRQPPQTLPGPSHILGFFSHGDGCTSRSGASANKSGSSLVE